MNQRVDVALYAKLSQNTHQGARRQEMEWNWSLLDCHNVITLSKQALAPERPQGNEQGPVDLNAWQLGPQPQGKTNGGDCNAESMKKQAEESEVRNSVLDKALCLILCRHPGW